MALFRHIYKAEVFAPVCHVSFLSGTWKSSVWEHSECKKEAHTSPLQDKLISEDLEHT